MAAPGKSVAERYLDNKAMQDTIFAQMANQSGQDTVYYLQQTIQLILKDTAEISNENNQLKASLAQQPTTPGTLKSEEKDDKVAKTTNPFNQTAHQAAIDRATKAESDATKNAVHLKKSRENEQALQHQLNTLQAENNHLKASKQASPLSSSGLSEHDCLVCQQTFEELIASGDTLLKRVHQLEAALTICLNGKKPCLPTPPSSPQHVCTGLTDDDIQKLIANMNQNIQNGDTFILRIAQLENSLRAAGVQVPGSPTLVSKKRPRSDDGIGDDDDDSAKDRLPKLAKAEARIADFTQSLSRVQVERDTAQAAYKTESNKNIAAHAKSTAAREAFKQVYDKTIKIRKALANPYANDPLEAPPQGEVDPDVVQLFHQRIAEIEAAVGRLIAEEAPNPEGDEDCETKLAEKDAEIANLKRINTRLEVEKGGLRQNLDSAQDDRRQLRALLAATNDQLVEAAKQAGITENNIIGLTSDNVRIQKDLTNAKAEITNLKQRLADAEYGARDQDKIRELEVKITGLTGEVRRLTRQLDDCNARNGGSNQGNNDAATQDHDRIDELEAENTRLQTDKIQLTQLLVDCFAAGGDNGNQENDDAEKQKLQAQIDALNGQLEALQQEANSGTKKPCKNCKKCKNCNCGSGNNATIIQQLIAATTRNLELLKQLKPTGNNPVSAGNNANQTLQDKLDSAAATSRTLIARHHATLAELQKAKGTITTLQRLLAECRDVADANPGDQNLQPQLQAAQENLKTLQTQFDAYKAARKALEDNKRECEDLEKRYHEQQKDLTELQRERRDLIKKLADKTKEAEGHDGEVRIQIARNVYLERRIAELERLLAECNRARNILPPIIREQGTQTDQENNADQGNGNDQGTQTEPAQGGGQQQVDDDCADLIEGRDNYIAELQNQVNDLSDRVENRDERIGQLEHEAEVAGTDLQGETNRANAAEVEDSCLAQELDDASNAQIALADENARLGNQATTLRAENGILRAEAIGVQNHIRGQNAQIDDANAQITDLSAQITVLEGQVAGLPGHVAVQQGTVTDCEEKLAARNVEIQDLKDQIKQLNIDIDLHLALQRTLNERAATAEAAKNCDEVVAAGNARIKELYEQTLDLQADRDFMIRSQQSINAGAAGYDPMEVDDNANADEPRNPAVGAATQMAFDLSHRLDEANDQIAALKAANEALTAQGAAPGGALPDNVQELLALVNAARITLDQTRAQVIALNIQVTSLNTQVATLTTERDTLRARNVAEGRRPSGCVRLVVNNGGSRPNSPTSPAKPKSPVKPESLGNPDSSDGSDGDSQNLGDHIDELEQQLKDCEELGGNNQALIDLLKQDLELAREVGQNLEESLDRIKDTMDELRQELADEHNERWPARKTRQYKEAAAKRKLNLKDPKTIAKKRTRREDPAVKQKRLWRENGWHKDIFGSPPVTPPSSDSDSA
ncbi:uncharacterized protein PAC_16130 [Phialocephala subalpina]|uniref:Uncharacterized protein n=1 Tax=Phialocephala subalpina TaxID=576137 RepID=A0A1L7XMG9_9HELO|nr:uncharacterized protein PAC_16130 [Phialocephala subalpina]